MTTKGTGERSMALLRFIKSYTSKNGYAPSFEEMRIAVAVGSKAYIHRLLVDLEERKLIRRAKFRARRITVIENFHCPECGAKIARGA